MSLPFDSPTDSHVAAEARALHVAWSAGDPDDLEHRRASGRRLGELRRLFRSQPTLFPPDAIETLKAVAESLAATRPSPEAVLEKVWGYEAFRPGQREIIDTVLARRDCIGVMPTGAGKSLTYQIPARILEGTVLVVSPLIALMKDQVDSVNEAGISGTFLNSSLPSAERDRRMRALRDGVYEIVYAAPEGLEASAGRALDGVPLSLIAVDEAHCISQWGHDFRPAYRNLAGLKRRFNSVPVLALTATATEAVTRDIASQLAMQSPALFRGSFFRRNLRILAVKKGGAARVRDGVLAVARARRGQSGIVYCLSRKSTESTAEYLGRHGVKSGAYHAGLSATERTRVQDDFQRDAIDVVCATIAFGMGIDKPNVRFVVHRDMPRSIESYYQEIGRAGRDGRPSDCVLFYSWADVLSYERMLSEGEGTVRASQLAQARAMFRLAEAEGCRHARLVHHFGESMSACGDACDRCAPAPARAVAAPPRTRAAAPAAIPAPPPAPPESGDLLARLKTLRRELAQQAGMPAYIIASDAVLEQIAARRPTNDQELLAIPGIGPRKLERYGALLLGVVRSGGDA